jgi:hypothetical protein
MKLCPECGKIADYNAYFGAYICNKCHWKDDAPNRERLAKYHSLHERDNSVSEKQCSCGERKLITV